MVFLSLSEHNSVFSRLLRHLLTLLGGIGPGKPRERAGIGPESSLLPETSLLRKTTRIARMSLLSLLARFWLPRSDSRLPEVVPGPIPGSRRWSQARFRGCPALPWCTLPTTPCTTLPVLPQPTLPCVHATLRCRTDGWCTLPVWSWVPFWASPRSRTRSSGRINIPVREAWPGPGRPAQRRA